MAQQKSLIRRVFGVIGRIFNAFRQLVFGLFVLVFLSMAYLAWKGGPPIEIPDGSAMVIVPFGQVVDQDDGDPRERVAEGLFGEEPRVTVLNDMLDAIDSAAEDARIKLLFLKLDTGFWAGQAQLEELAAAIARFRETGKPVYAWSPDMGQTEYFLAAQADKVFMDPMGMLFFPGFENYPLYFRDALEKLGVTVNIFRVGEFKSAVEPFMRNSMSDSARANAKGWLDGLWEGWREAVAQARGLEPSALQAYSDNFTQLLSDNGGDPAKVALAAGLVDEVVDLQDVRRMTGDIVGMDEELGSFRQIDHRSYLRALDQEGGAHLAHHHEEAAPKRISVAVVQGEIVDGESSPGLAGGDSVRRLIDEAREDKDSAALVLRVDSPGGSVFASEQIRRAVERYKQTGRPVVVSMASVAASGGYWISMNADSILAHATTITGSIGVFGMIPTFEGTLEQLGIHTDGVGTTRWSGGLSPVRELSPTAKQGIQMLVEKDYRQFIGRVAEARGMAVSDVDAVAQGQVWTGAAALERGLVDAIGDFDAAVTRAAELAQIENYEIDPLMPPQDLRIQLLDRFSFLHGLLPTPLSGLISQLTHGVDVMIRRWSDPRGIYAHCLCTPRS